MKFNEKELITISERGKAVIEDRLGHQKPPTKDWSDWMSQGSQFKDRWFKLVSNLLFYYRLGEADSINYSEPIGVFVLETCVVRAESSRRVPFAFSISFQDEPQKKHIFSCRSEQDVTKWVSTLNQSSYEYLRKQLIIIEKKLAMRHGDENQIPKSALTTAKSLVWNRIAPGFTCHLDSDSNTPQQCPFQDREQGNNQRKDVNLIDL